MDEIRWEDPPRSDGKIRTDWTTLLIPLMENEGRWAMIATRKSTSAAASVAANLNRRRLRIPPGKWEFVSRSSAGEGRVYGRYLGAS